MEVKIGVQSIRREIEVETSASVEDVERWLSDAIANGGLFTLPDGNGGKILIPAEKIGYVEITGTEQRRVGFSTR